MLNVSPGSHTMSRVDSSAVRSVPIRELTGFASSHQVLIALLKTDAVLHDAAISKDRCRRQIARAFSGDEADDAGDLFRSRHPPKRYRGIELREPGRILHRREVDRGRDRARTHPDDEDVMSGELEAGRAREHAHAAFRQTVRRVAGHWPVLVYRADV